MVKTTDAIKKAGNTRELAHVLGISTQAIYLWHENVPELRIYELRVKKPDWFDAKGELIKPRKKRKA